MGATRARGAGWIYWACGRWRSGRHAGRSRLGSALAEAEHFEGADDFDVAGFGFAGLAEGLFGGGPVAAAGEDEAEVLLQIGAGAAVAAKGEGFGQALDGAGPVVDGRGAQG